VQLQPFNLNIILLTLDFYKLVQDTGEWEQIVMYYFPIYRHSDLLWS